MRAWVHTPIIARPVLIAVQVLGGFKEWPLLEDVDMVQRCAAPGGGRVGVGREDMDK